MDKEELNIVYCPTNLMLADYFTKPLQGELLHKFKDIIMVRVSPFTLSEDTFYIQARRVLETRLHQKIFAWVLESH